MRKRNAKPDFKIKMRQYAKQQKKNGYQKEYQQNNPDKLKQYALNHNNHKITTKEWESTKKYFNHRCAYCGLPIEEHWIVFRGVTQLGDFHREHVDHNGSDGLDNCVPSCKQCNSEKWKFTLDEWYNKDNSIFTEERFQKILNWLDEDYKKFIQNTIK